MRLPHTPLVFNGPQSSIDPWAVGILEDPFAAYAELRELGPAVWLSKYDMVAVARYDEARTVLADWKRFSSASGVGADPKTNADLPAGTLGSDPPEHTDSRRRIAPEFSPGRIAAHTQRIREVAVDLVDSLMTRSNVDVICDVAAPYVTSIVGDILRARPDKLAELPSLAARAFNLFGPACEQQRDGLRAFRTIVDKAIDLGRDPRALADAPPSPEAIERAATYIFPGIDTTVQAIGSALTLFAQHPGQWTMVRQNPSLIPSATAEVLRLHSPVRYFTRLTTAPVMLGNTTVPADTRVLIMYGSANRDPRQFSDPNRFDIARPAHQHLTFGHGVHRCVGANLALEEINTLLEVLRTRVRSFDPVGEPVREVVNLTIHGPHHLGVCFKT